MAHIELYSSKNCPYCVKAKGLFQRKGVQYEEIDLTGDDAGRSKLVERANGMRTVPQIFIDGRHIGGCDDLYELDRKGELDRLLAG